MRAHPHGTVCFAELATPDPDSAAQLYAHVLGWRTRTGPSGISLFHVDGLDVGLLREVGEGIPGWVPFVSVASVDATIGRARELGATVRQEPSDVPGVARRAVIEDPAGGAMGLWEARGHAGVQLAAAPGAPWWTEFIVLELEAAKRFYSALFGWTLTDTRVTTGRYTMCRLNGVGVAGLMPIEPSWGLVPPRWQTLYIVSDCEDAVDRVREQGAEVFFGPVDVAGAGRLAVVSDRDDAVFVVIAPTAPAT